MRNVLAPPAPAVAADERPYYNISEAAARLGVSRVSIWRWIRDGRLPAARLGHRTIRIKREDLDQLVQYALPDSRFWVARRQDAAAGDGPESGRAPRADWRATGPSEHLVQFYEADAAILDAVAEYLGAGLRADEAAIVVATPAHRDGLAERLQRAGLDLAGARARGQYVALDAAELLETFMIAGAPDPARFAAVVGSIVARAAAGRRPVRIFGEMVALLAAEGNPAAAVRLEALWNDLRDAQAFSLFCAYPLVGPGGRAITDLLANVCVEHSRVIPAESYSALPTAEDRLRAIAVLQQKAAALEAEIADRKHAEARLEQAFASERAAREAVEDALRLRDEFISVAAHELRTPLTALSGQTQLVLRRLEGEGQLDPERVAQGLQAIRAQANKLSRLIHQLLDVTRFESGKLALEWQPTDLTALVEQAVSDARLWSEDHPIAVEAPAALEAQVDSLRLEQVLTNLLSNAVKYSPADSPVEVVLAQLDGGAVELSVRDRGVGIPPEKRERIFERFYQAHDDHRSGLGLGLYVSRQIVELHGGEIRAEFPPDGGTRFAVRLPLAGTPSVAAAAAR